MGALCFGYNLFNLLWIKLPWYPYWLHRHTNSVVSLTLFFSILLGPAFRIIFILEVPSILLFKEDFLVYDAVDVLPFRRMLMESK